MQQKTVVVIEAVDWAIMVDQVSANHPWDVTRGFVCGFLVKETDDLIVLAPQWFRDGDVRATLVVPKCTIINRTDLALEPKDQHEEANGETQRKIVSDVQEADGEVRL